MAISMKNIIIMFKKSFLPHYIIMCQRNRTVLTHNFKPGVPFVGHRLGEQYSLRCDAAECGDPSGAILFA